MRCGRLAKRRVRRGMVGIEAAIVLIAFVIVAAALAFVVLNMGFFTTQKSKEAMSSGLKEASTALEIDGSVLGKVESNSISQVMIPLKTSSGRNPVDLIKVAISAKTPSKAEVYTVQDIALIVNDNKLYLSIDSTWYTATDSITVYVANKTDNTEKKWTLYFVISDDPFITFSNVTNVFQNITQTLSEEDYVNVTIKLDSGNVTLKDKDGNIVNSVKVPKVLFIEYQGDGDTLLEINEKWAVVIDTVGLSLTPYITFTIEIKPSVGAPLTVERMVPPQLSDQIVLLE